LHNLSVAVVDYSYMFRLLESNHHQVVDREYRKETTFVLVKKSVEHVQATFVLRQDVWCLNVAVKQYHTPSSATCHVVCATDSSAQQRSVVTE